MPAAVLSSDVLGGVAIPICSHIPNNYASAFVRTLRADMVSEFSYPANMAKRDGAPWYLPEWMEATGFRGWGSHTRFREQAGWSKATMSALYNGDQDFNPKALKEAALVLKCEAFELLMHPETAMAYRSMRKGAFTIVKTDTSEEPAERTGTGTAG